MKITVNYDQLYSGSQFLMSKAEQYESTILQGFQKIQEISSIWQGEDAQAFLSQAQALQPKLKEMETVITQYAKAMQNCAQSYQNVMENRAAMARSLSI